MRLISYDIGIKNLAYCLLEYDADSKKISILDWNIINLLENENIQRQCSQTIPGKTKKQPTKPCQCSAKFQKNGQYYCLKHAKKGNHSFLIPTKKHTKPHFKKMKVGELQQLANSLFLFSNGEGSLKKDEMIDTIFNFYQKKCFEPLVEKKTENAGDTDLIIIGKRMKNILNQSPYTDTITHVVIENQISPIATRMKTLQGMLTQYYIDKNSDLNIEFVSSVHKLKQFAAGGPKVPPTTPSSSGKPTVSPETPSLKEKVKGEKLENTLKTESEIEVEKKAFYKNRKESGITYCSRIIENNDWFKDWKSKLDTKKKDDLADCFLQGLWYFKQKKIIMYAEDLKINIV
jgi:hypothetical protein